MWALRIGVSACLTGARVRFDGGHKRDDFVSSLAEQVELVPVCPEMEVGMGAPRESLRLVRRGPSVTLVGTRSQRDWGDQMRQLAERRVAQLATLDLHGFVVKKDSPSCGMERVRVHDDRGGVRRDGVGLFTAVLRARMPLLPVEEEGRLRNPALREAFLVRVFVYRELQALFARAWTYGELVALHTRMKLLVLAYEPAAYTELGRLIAHGRALPRAELTGRYAGLLLDALSRPAPPSRHVNVLQHMAGYFKRQVPAAERHELSELIDDYRAGRVPLAAPLALIRHHVRKHAVQYLARQMYLAPYPKEFAHV